MSDTKKKIDEFFEDIQKNIKNPKDADYIKEKANDLISVFLDKMDKILEYHEMELNSILEKQKNMESKIIKMEKLLDNIEKDIYLEEDLDFDIICPYCDNEFSIEYDEEQKETECPECHNIIELDWGGNLEEGTDICYGNCSHCNGCSDEDDDDEK